NLLTDLKSSSVVFRNLTLTTLDIGSLLNVALIDVSSSGNKIISRSSPSVSKASANSNNPPETEAEINRAEIVFPLFKKSTLQPSEQSYLSNLRAETANRLVGSSTANKSKSES